VALDRIIVEISLENSQKLSESSYTSASLLKDLASVILSRNMIPKTESPGKTRAFRRRLIGNYQLLSSLQQPFAERAEAF
jgi:hypothetical protein